MELRSQAKNPLVELVVAKANQRGIQNQKELAEKAGVAPAVVSRLFNGRSASLNNIYALLSYLDLIKLEIPKSDEIAKLYRELAEERKIRIKLADENMKLRKVFFERRRKGDVSETPVAKLRKLGA